MDPEDVFVQTALVFRAMRAVRAALLRILAALNLQVVLHVPEPAVTLATVRTLVTTWILVEAARSLRNLQARRARIVRVLVLTDRLAWMLILLIIRPRYHPCKKIKTQRLVSGHGDFAANRFQRQAVEDFVLTLLARMQNAAA